MCMHDQPIQSSEAVALWRRLLPIGGMATAATCLPPLGAVVILGATPVVGPWLRDQQVLGVLLYVAAFVVLAGLALLPTYAQALLGGWAFGFVCGFPAAMTGFIGAAMLAYVLARRVAGTRLSAALERRPRLRAAHRTIASSGFRRSALLIMLIRLLPTSPFALTNVMLASARVNWLPYLIGTALGLAPRTAAAVLAADGLAQFQTHHRAGDASWAWDMSIAAGAIAAVVLLGLIARGALRRLTGDPAACDDQSDQRCPKEQPWQ